MPDSNELLELDNAITQAQNLHFNGVLTHAGHSYHCRSIQEIQVVAETERASVVKSASRLKSKLDLDCEIISTGSTPTATYATSFEGLTETRPGVYMFGDIDQYFIGSCQIKDIATSVLTTVIGHNKQANRILIDAGGWHYQRTSVPMNSLLSRVMVGFVMNPAATSMIITWKVFIKNMV